MSKCPKCNNEVDRFNIITKELLYQETVFSTKVKYLVTYKECPICKKYSIWNKYDINGLSNILHVNKVTIYGYVAKGMPHKYKPYTYEGSDDRLIFNLNKVYEWLCENYPVRSKVLKFYFDNAYK